MRQNKYIYVELLAEARRSFVAQGVPVDEVLLREVTATLARLAPNYIDADAQQRCVLSSEGGT